MHYNIHYNKGYNIQYNIHCNKGPQVDGVSHYNILTKSLSLRLLYTCYRLTLHIVLDGSVRRYIVSDYYIPSETIYQTTIYRLTLPANTLPSNTTTHLNRSLHTRLTQMCAVTHSNVCRDSFICVPWRIHTCAMTHSYVCHDAFKCVPRLIDRCDRTHENTLHWYMRDMTHVTRLNATRHVSLIHAAPHIHKWDAALIWVTQLICVTSLNWVRRDSIHPHRLLRSTPQSHRGMRHSTPKWVTSHIGRHHTPRETLSMDTWGSFLRCPSRNESRHTQTSHIAHRVTETRLYG